MSNQLNFMTSKLILSVLLLSMFVTLLSGCDLIYKTGLVPIPHQVISGPIEIGSEWLELIPPQPVKPLGVGNYIVIKNPGYKKWEKDGDRAVSEDQTTLYLADGRATKIEAYLFDDKGEIYHLTLGGTGGVDKSVELTTAAIHIIRNGKSVEIKKDQPLPTDRTYTKLKIRSELPIRCEGIEWISSIGK